MSSVASDGELPSYEEWTEQSQSSKEGIPPLFFYVFFFSGVFAYVCRANTPYFEYCATCTKKQMKNCLKFSIDFFPKSAIIDLSKEKGVIKNELQIKKSGRKIRYQFQ